MAASSDDLRYEHGADMEKSSGSSREKENYNVEAGEEGAFTLAPQEDDHDVYVSSFSPHSSA